jgi:carbamoyl-phosphate synthase large subunit
MLTTSMKSVGEAMSIGRSFAESVQKALRSMETGLSGFDEIAIEGVESAGKDAVKAALAKPSPDRLPLIAQAYRHGLTTAEIHEACHFEPWFIEQIREIVEMSKGQQGCREIAPPFCGSSKWAFRMPASASSRD